MKGKEVRGDRPWERYFFFLKKAVVAMLISDKANCRAIKMIRNKGHEIKINRLILPEGLKTWQTRGQITASPRMRQNPLELHEAFKCTITAGALRTPLSSDRRSRSSVRAELRWAMPSISWSWWTLWDCFPQRQQVHAHLKVTWNIYHDRQYSVIKHTSMDFLKN